MTLRHGRRPDGHRPGLRGLLPGRRPRTGAHPRRARAALNGAGRARRGASRSILVSEGFIYDPNHGRVQARAAGVAARQRRDLLPGHPRARGHVGLHHGRSSAPRSRPGHRRRLHGEPRGLGGRGVESPPTAAASSSRTPTTCRRASSGSPTRRAAYYLLGYVPSQHRARRQVPQDPGEAGGRQGPAGARAQGLLRAERRRARPRSRPKKGPDPVIPGGARLALRAGPASRCA